VALRIRRELPDNLDPLVDTLANVVGILVIVIALTQLELGDALARVIELDDLRAAAERDHADSLPHQMSELAARNEALLRRTDVASREAIELAHALLEALSAIDETTSDDRRVGPEERAKQIAELERTVASAEQSKETRAEYARTLRQVPSQMVARLPDPQIVTGIEAWILVRHGRVYVVDKKALFDEGSRAIGRILANGQGRSIRPDEFEAIARYLRKHSVGLGSFEWQFKTDPSTRVELAWRSRDGGIERTRLAQDPTWSNWLREKSPDRDFIQFHVWSDSFETYLEARQAVEAAGFRAGWVGHAEDEEIELGLRFGVAQPLERQIEVD
jgi:hypothetical protein